MAGSAERGRRRGVTLVLSVVAVVALAAGCEAGVVLEVDAQRNALRVPSLGWDPDLSTSARAHSAEMCQAGVVTPSDELSVAYPDRPAAALYERVGSAPLDALATDPDRTNPVATAEVWAQWSTDSTLVEPQWDSIGVGEHRCTDGRLFSTLVLREDPPALATPADTSQIELVSSVTQGGWRYDYYRNRANACSISGYQTFVIGTKVGSSATATRPLWVKMHGGGVGYFDPAGLPRPASYKTEESRASLIAKVDAGLMADVMAAPEGFRVATVSMCSHDAYAGADVLDPYNPNTLPDGSPRRTSGLLATKAAVQFAMTAHPTDDVFLHGGSAGSAGSFHVAWALQEQGIAPTGVVADSGILNQAWEQAQIDQDLPCAMPAEAVDLVPARWHPDVSDPTNQPDLLVSEGRLDVPLMHVWNVGDNPNVCGELPMQCPLRDGSVVTMASAECVHEPMRRAIAAQGPLSRSANLAVCVDDPHKEWACDKHVVTTSGTLVNTAAGGPADYNEHILAWVRDRLADD